MTDADRIAELEHECIWLRGLLSQHGITPPVLDLPDDIELARLLHLVWDAHPNLRPQSAIELFPMHVRNALCWLNYVRPADKLNDDFSADYFGEQCVSWLRAQCIHGGTTTRALCAACVASGIATSSFERWPYDIGLGLIPHSTIAHPTARWRSILAAGAVRPALQLNSHGAPLIQKFNMIQSWSGDDRPGLFRY